MPLIRHALFARSLTPTTHMSADSYDRRRFLAIGLTAAVALTLKPEAPLGTSRHSESQCGARTGTNDAGV